MSLTYLLASTPVSVDPAVLDAIRSELAAQSEDQATNLNFVWTMVAAGLVFFMQLGFLFLEAGASRSKNSINVAQKNLTDFFVSVGIFSVFGFALMFGPSMGGWFGWSSDYLMSPHTDNWSMAFFVFQAMFVGTAATIVSGAVAERMTYSSYIMITLVVAAIIYPVFGHWAWGNLLVGDNKAWLADMGFIDFAGSTVVHSVEAWVALAAIICVGPRVGKFNADGTSNNISGHSMVMATSGALILFIGWIGFNGGSTTTGSPDIGKIIANTVVAGAIGGAVGMIVGRFKDGLYRPQRGINGLLGGLVGITAGCDAVLPGGAAMIGIIAGASVHYFEDLLEKVFKLDDVVGAVAVHGFCGVLGTLFVAVFATPDKLAADSRLAQFGVQFLGVSIAFVWTFGLSYVALKLIAPFAHLRVSEQDEKDGLNHAEHGENLGTHDIQKKLMDIIAGKSDLSTRLDESTGDEAADLAKILNPFIAKVQKLVEDVSMNSRRLSHDLDTISEKVSYAANDVHFEAMQAESATQEVVKGNTDAEREIRALSEKASSVSQTANAIRTSMGEMIDVLSNLCNSIQSIDSSASKASEIVEDGARVAREASETIGRLSEAASRIEHIVGLIADIQSQTNLLALNATIEAQRAGEAGKGFAVVAGEVKALSARTAKATEDIRQALNDIIGSTEDSRKQMRLASEVIGSIKDSVIEITQSTHTETENARAMQSSLNSEMDRVNQVADDIHHFSEASLQAAKMAHDAAEHAATAAKSVGAMTEHAHNNLLTAKDVAQTAEDLDEISENLSKNAGAIAR